MSGALKRALESLQRQTNIALADVPAWLYRLPFVHANAAADPWIAGKWIEQFRSAERLMRSKAAPSVPHGADWPVGTQCHKFPAIPPWAADSDNAQLKMIIAIVRMAMGAALEAAIANDARELCAPGARIEDTGGALPRLYNDGFLVATWTSVHAHYVATIQSGVEEPPCPDLSTIPNAANEWDLSDLFARRFCPRQCPKNASPLLHVLMRSTYVAMVLNYASIKTMPTPTPSILLTRLATLPSLSQESRKPWLEHVA